jgi:UDP-galactopyranose mutase
MRKVCIVGAGFSGAVIAHQLATAGYACDVYESRPHVAGNCHTERDPKTGIMLHMHGPHIFHTNNERVWNYVRCFGEFAPFTNRVKAITAGRVFSLPINLLTLNQFFSKTLSPEQARLFLGSLGDHSISNPRSFEEQALRFVGRELYEAFFKNYTMKQWGVDPAELPASILKRLPIRFTYDDNYYDSRFQGIPVEGYTHIVSALLEDKNIRVLTDSKIALRDTNHYCHTFYTGPLDEWFDFSEGRLSYRSLDFSAERHPGDYQGNPVINFCDADVPWTRICEHKHFAPWETHDETVIFKEFSRDCEVGDVPYYPVRLLDDQRILQNYARLASQQDSVTFVGRLATYRYLDMDVAIEEALLAADNFMKQSTLPAYRKESSN